MRRSPSRSGAAPWTGRCRWARRSIGPRASRGGDGLTLVRERAVDTVRTLLGRETPYVGRDRELASLTAVLDECIGDSVARAVVVLSPPGYGKSRLRYELVRRARDDAGPRGIGVWLGRGDP